MFAQEIEQEPLGTVIETPEAFAELYESHRYKVYWGGRGGAKSTAFADALLVLGEQAPLRILCTREKQNSIKESVHALLEARIKSGGFTGYEVLRDRIDHENGTKIFFMGLWNNIDSIKSVDGVDICWVEEANTVSEESWKKLIPTIRKPGSEIWVSFNPELKMDAAYQRFVINPPKNALVKQVSWRDNPWFTQELRDEMDHLRATDEQEYLHVWEGELKQFADGAVYAPQLKKARADGRICDIPVMSVETHTFWDLGRNDSTAIWFMQIVGREHRFIDYYEHRLVELDHYIRVLKDKGYNYGTHYLPHDVEVTELTSTRGSRKDILISGGIRNVRVVPRIANVNDGIERVRQAFPQCYFDQTRCERGLDALANYQYVFDEQYNTHRKVPLHNWASNGADAFRQYAQGFMERRSIDTSEYRKPARYFE